MEYDICMILDKLVGRLAYQTPQTANYAMMIIDCYKMFSSISWEEWIINDADNIIREKITRTAYDLESKFLTYQPDYFSAFQEVIRPLLNRIRN
jgi:hypothetical protein